MSLKTIIGRYAAPYVRSLIPNDTWRYWGYKPDPGLQFEQAFEKVGWVYACTRVISRNCAQVPVIPVKSIRGPGGKTRDEQLPDSHPWSQLLLKPNEEEDMSGLVEATCHHLELRGEAFWELEGALRGDNGLPRPARIFNRPPQWLFRVNISNEQYDSFEMRLPTLGGLIEVPGDLGVFFKFFNPLNPWRGMAPMKAAYLAADSSYAANVMNARFFERGAMPSLAISMSDKGPISSLTPEQRERYREQAEQLYGGISAQDLHGILVLGPGEKVESFGSELKDMHFADYLRFNKDEILAVFGVPPIMLGNVDDANRSNSETQRRFFWEENIIPLCDDIGSMINRKIAPRFGKGIAAKFDYAQVPAMRIDMKSLADGVIPWIKARCLTINEARTDYLNREPVEWGDDPVDMQQDTQDTGDTGDIPTDPADAQDGEPAQKQLVLRKLLMTWKNSAISRVRDGARAPWQAFPPQREARRAMRKFGFNREEARDLAQATSIELSVHWDTRNPTRGVADLFDRTLERLPAAE